MAERMVIPDDEAFDIKDIIRKSHGRVSDSTLRRWHAKYGICRQVGRKSKMLFSYPAVLILQHGDVETLELLREGKRTDPRLIPYLQAAGVLV